MYEPKLSLIDTEKAICIIKQTFEKELAEKLNLLRVSAPLFLQSDTGLNDNLNGVENPVSFVAADYSLEIVQSLAKWKRLALYRYEIDCGYGIYTDMNAVRPCEVLDPIHSIYVDQWDWEKTIDLKDRNLNTLKETVTHIYQAILNTEKLLNQKYPNLSLKLPPTITFISTQELEDMFPTLTPEEREYQFTQMHKAVFIIGIGGVLASGNIHGNRAPDYDDWTMNGDIIFYHEALDIALEISSMGIRVDKETLEKQLALTNSLDRKELNFHKMILNEVLPFSIGGGIGQSRLSMWLLEKVHIGEVQVSVWSEKTIQQCAQERIFLL